MSIDNDMFGWYDPSTGSDGKPAPTGCCEYPTISVDDDGVKYCEACEEEWPLAVPSSDD